MLSLDDESVQVLGTTHLSASIYLLLYFRVLIEIIVGNEIMVAFWMRQWVAVCL